ncbi:hypothetical protein [Ferrimonas marina]|uniref:Uncharacterized protein n=1 Tax=Ferrimonas marina TaxID=299255 RepID=A0A1M5TT43_9GAMM|nr:hypothetical protein [Ferrimonas marina]SHH53947.1 hypothetical protein SAMN02745129_2269 [Ferrimonas marina]
MRYPTAFESKKLAQYLSREIGLAHGVALQMLAQMYCFGEWPELKRCLGQKLDHPRGDTTYGLFEDNGGQQWLSDLLARYGEDLRRLPGSPWGAQSPLGLALASKAYLLSDRALAVVANRERRCKRYSARELTRLAQWLNVLPLSFEHVRQRHLQDTGPAPVRAHLYYPALNINLLAYHRFTGDRVEVLVAQLEVRSDAVPRSGSGQHGKVAASWKPDLVCGFLRFYARQIRESGYEPSLAVSCVDGAKVVAEVSDPVSGSDCSSRRVTEALVAMGGTVSAQSWGPTVGAPALCLGEGLGLDC